MRVQVLDERAEESAQCILCSATLKDYISSLPKTYQDFAIQREIVSNVYLDRLVDTVLAGRHIPIITLVTDKRSLRRSERSLDVRDFKILDGLQRTFRLEAINSTIEFCLEKLDRTEDYLNWSRYKLSRAFSSDLRDINSNTDILKSVVRAWKEDERSLRTCFERTVQWFEIWVGLTPDEEVTKMLTLNAGHKPVQIRHQLELLFLHLLPELEASDRDFTLVREREVRSAQFSKRREIGHFHFAHIVTCLLSLHERAPVTPSSALIQDIQRKELDLSLFGDLTTARFLGRFVSFLVRVDRLLHEQYGELGTLWMGREVALAGLFGALGKYALEHDVSEHQAFREFERIIAENPKVLNLESYESERNNLDLKKVNIGSVNRTAVFAGVNSLLQADRPRRINWATHFGGGAR